MRRALSHAVANVYRPQTKTDQEDTMTEPSDAATQPPAEQQLPAAEQQGAKQPPDAELVREQQAYQLEVWKRNADAHDVAEPTTLREQLAYAKALADADLLPVAYRQKPANVLLAMQTAAELGLPRMAALRLLNVVEGQPRLGGEGVRAAILARGHECWTDEPELNKYGLPVSTTAHGKRKDSGMERSATFTLEQAARAGLCTVTRDEDGVVTAIRARSSNDKPLPWEQYTEDMLDHRAMTRLARRLFPDVTGGLAREDDTGDNPTGRQGESKPAPAQAAQPRAAAVAEPEPEVAAGPELRRTDLPDPYNPADDLALAGTEWWHLAGSDVRRRSAQQLAADRLLRAAHEGLAEVPLPSPAEVAAVQVPPVVERYLNPAWGRSLPESNPDASVELEDVHAGNAAAAMGGPEDVVDAEIVTEAPALDVDRRPYVGEGAEGARASAQIDREEIDGLGSGPDDVERRAYLEGSAAAWDAQAERLSIPARVVDGGALDAMAEEAATLEEPAPLVENPPAELDPFTMPLVAAPEVGEAPAGVSRADLWRQVEELAEKRGKTVKQLLARVVIAEQCEAADLPDAALAAFLQAQQGVT